MSIHLSEKLTQNGLIILLALFSLLHAAILLQLVPFEMIWGGRLTDAAQMRLFETVSLGINLLMLAAVCVQAGYIKAKISPVIIRGILWLMFGIFLMNTFGNLLSNHAFERYVFTPVTLLMAVFCWKLARSKPAFTG